MDEGLESFDSTQENLCEECGATGVEVVFIRNRGLRMQVCQPCRDKLLKESKGESKSFLAYFLPESKSILYELGVTGADSPNTAMVKLLKEIKRLREEIKNASTIKVNAESGGNSPS